MSMDEQVRTRAYQLWEADGSPPGQDQAYWFKAVAELAQSVADSIKPAPKKARSRTTKKAA